MNPKGKYAKDAKGKFLPGNVGRPLGSRNKLEESFLTALHQDFDAFGKQALEQARLADPTGYIRVVATLMPKHSEKTIKHDVERLTDQELIELVRNTRDQLRGPTGPGSLGDQAQSKAKLN